MATRWKIMFAALEGQVSLVNEVRSRLVNAWEGRWPIEPVEGALSEIEPGHLRTIDGIVLIGAKDATPSSTLTLLNSVEEAGVPVMVLVDEDPEPGNVYEFAGALIEKQSTPASRLCALLEGVLHRQNDVKRLRSEVALSQRFHGGLKGQIAKMHEELQLAAVVQREFLPRELPAMHGVEVASLWRPSNYVSGDIYDLIRLDEDHIGVFVADAVGHGVPAALMTMVICRSLSTKEISGNSYRLVEPSEVLSRLNAEMIRRQGHSTRFATAVYALINCRTRMVRLAGAGHPPPIWLGAARDSELLETTGGLLGVFPDESYEQIEIELALNDRLLFYTDGFEQAFPSQPTSAYECRIPTTQYREEFDQLGRLPTALEMIDIISQRLDDQIGSLHQADDLTLICLRAGSLSQTTRSTSAGGSVDDGIDEGENDSERPALRLAG